MFNFSGDFSFMNTHTINQLKKLNTDLNDLLDQLKKYPEERLNRPPRENAWSALQTMHHLILAEKYSVQYVRKKMSFETKFKKVNAISNLRAFGMNTYLGSPFKFAAPEAISGENLPDKSSFWETAKNWKEQRQELEKFLEDLPTEMWDKEIYKHPAVGRLSFNGMLSFFHAHFKRHRKQIMKAVEY